MDRYFVLELLKDCRTTKQLLNALYLSDWLVKRNQIWFHNSHPMPLVKKPSQSVSSSELSHFMFDDINNGNVPLQIKVSAPTIWEIKGTKSLTPAPSAEPPRYMESELQ